MHFSFLKINFIALNILLCVVIALNNLLKTPAQSIH